MYCSSVYAYSYLKVTYNKDESPKTALAWGLHSVRLAEVGAAARGHEFLHDVSVSWRHNPTTTKHF